MSKSPNQGGCWYCEDDEPFGMLFSWEFDTNVHATCLLLAAQDKKDEEAQIMARELLP